MISNFRVEFEMMLVAEFESQILRSCSTILVQNWSILMGGASSKAARKLPKRAETPSWAGSRTTDPTVTARPNTPRPSETKNEGRFIT